MALAAVLDDTEEKCNGTKLARLLIDGGTQTLRRTFDSFHSPANLQSVCHAQKALLINLRKKRILNDIQWDKLYPPSGAAPDSKTFDITLLFVLLRNICGLTAPATGWDALPHAGDVSREANLARIKLYRNQVYGHVTGTGLRKTDFEQYWSDISGALIALGADQISIDLLKSSTIGETEYLSLLSKWKTGEETLKDVVVDKFRRFEDKFVELNEKVDNLQQPDSKASLSEILSQCEFTGHITSLNNQYHQGTRLQLINSIKAFCSDSKAGTKALVVTALPGVGKSVLAAVICKELQENRTLGACHFIQHNNSQCNNPRVIVESIARHLCDNIDGFKDKLDGRLSSLLPDVRQKLDEMNLETVISVLLGDPLNIIKYLPENLFVVVIDALDECESCMRDGFVKVLLSKLPSLPQWIKFVLTSRPNEQLPTCLSHVTVVDIVTTDTNNTEDIRMFLSSHLGAMFPDDTYEQRETVVSNLTARSGGLFLYARFSVESAKSRGLSLLGMDEIFPKGISSVYEEYVTRSHAELRVGEELFINFLEAVVASQAPLPESLVLQILGLKQTTRQEKKQAREALKSLALLFPVEEKHISVFHKSLTDWLTEDEDKDEGHGFSVKLQDGHCVLAKHCLKLLREVKNHKSFPPELSDFEIYALKFGFYHMLEAGGYQKQLAECVQDLELLAAMTVARGEKTEDGSVQIQHSAIDKLYSELERIRRDCFNPPLQDLEHLLDRVRLIGTRVVSPHFVLECAANCSASAEIKGKAVGLFSSPKYKHCAWVEEHTVHTLEPKFRFTDLSCNKHTAVACVGDYSQRDSKDKQIFLTLKLSLENNQQPASAAVGWLYRNSVPNIQICPNNKHFIVYYHVPNEGVLVALFLDRADLVLELRDVQTLELQRKFVLDSFPCVSSSCVIRNNKLVVGCDDGTVRVFDVETGEREKTLYKFPFTLGGAYCIASSKGQLLTVGGGLALLWHSLTPPKHVQLTSGVISDIHVDQPVCFSPDGSLVTCACHGRDGDEPHFIIKVFNTKTVQLVNSLSVHFTSPHRLTFITNVHLMLNPLFYDTNTKVIRTDNGVFQELTNFGVKQIHRIGEGECVGIYWHGNNLCKLSFYNLI